MTDLTTVFPNDDITSARMNLITDYIENGTHRINTLSINVGGYEVVDSLKNIDANSISINGFEVIDSTFNLNNIYNVNFDGTIVTPYIGTGPARNYILQSEAFNCATNWTTIGTTIVVANQGTDPIGTGLADQIVAGTASTDGVSQTKANTDTGTFNFSVWLKADSGTPSVGLQVSSDVDTGTLCNVTLSTTWKRYSVTQALNSAHVNQIVYILNGTNTIYAWGAQLDLSSVPRKYIRTSTSCVATEDTITRNMNSFCSYSNIHSGCCLTVSCLSTFNNVAYLVRNNVQNNSCDGFVLCNQCAATSGCPIQRPSRTRYHARVWDTTPTATSKCHDWVSEIIPISASPTTSCYRIAFSCNGGAYSELLSVNNEGVLNVCGYSICGTAGYTGTFKSCAGETVTVKNGIIITVE